MRPDTTEIQTTIDRFAFVIDKKKLAGAEPLIALKVANDASIIEAYRRRSDEIGMAIGRSTSDFERMNLERELKELSIEAKRLYDVIGPYEKRPESSGLLH